MDSLAKIFGSAARLKTLRLFLFNKDAAFTPVQVSDRTKLSREVARKEIAELLSAGLIRKKGDRGATRYQVNPRFEQLMPLEEFVRDTTDVRPQQIVAALKKVGTLQLVALSGFFIGTLESQVDLLVVGDGISEAGLARVVRSLEAEFGREIRYASFPTNDFKYRLGVYDRLLRDVFDYPHRLLVNKLPL